MDQSNNTKADKGTFDEAKNGSQGPIQKTKEVAGAAKDQVTQGVEVQKDDLKDDLRFVQDKMQKGKATDFIWADVENALLASLFVYGIADFRAFARKEGAKLKGDPALLEKALNLPITRVEVLEVFKENLDQMEAKEKKNSHMYATAIEFLAREAKEKAEEKGEKSFLQRLYQNPEEDPVSLVVFDDTNITRKNTLIYQILVDKEEKQIVLAFRGSASARDWLTDVEFTMSEHSNPLKSRSSNTIAQAHRIGIHKGFYNYLFDADTNGKSKYDIINEHLVSLFETYPDYKLLVSGHSLGAALASLFTFQIGCEDKIPGIITCITFASPYVGNSHFFRAFQQLVLDGRIQYLRVTNWNDIVTKAPFNPFLGLALGRDSIYRHVGVELRLHKKGKYRFIFPTVRRGRVRLFLNGVADGFQSTLVRTSFISCICLENFVKKHGCNEYMQRLDKASDKLKKVHIHDLVVETEE